MISAKASSRMQEVALEKFHKDKEHRCIYEYNLCPICANELEKKEILQQRPASFWGFLTYPLTSTGKCVLICSEHGELGYTIRGR